MGNRHDFDPAEVEALLATDGGGLSSLSLDSDSLNQQAEHWVGRRMGAYRITEFIARGGMSSVYAGERCDGQFELPVAIKLIHTTGHQELARRLVREGRILASVQHPFIARILDSGIENGQPFLVMERVDGLAIDAYCEQHRLDLKARIALLEQVCEAVQFAHARLVIHRDIKPGNIMVTASGQPKLLDFGIAKVISHNDDDTTTGAPLLTPRFASPEMVSGAPVDVASDIYQLGLLLHFLVCGCHAQDPRTGSLSAITSAVLEQQPLSPSRSLERLISEDRSAALVVARARAVGVDRLRRALQGDVDAVVAQCLRKTPAHRYRSAGHLLDDLQAYRECRPVQARQVTSLYRLGRFVRRHRGGVATGALTLVALLTAMAVVVWSWRETLAAHKRAEAEAQTAEAVAQFLGNLLQQADPRHSGGRSMTVAELLDLSVEQLSRLAEQPLVQAKLQRTIAAAYFSLGRYQESRLAGESALALLDQIGNQEVLRIAVLNNLASAYAGLGLIDHALESASTAIALAESTGQSALTQAGATHALAVTLFDAGELKQAIVLERRALELLGDSSASLRGRVVILTTLASAQRKLGDYSQALLDYESALSLALENEVLAAQRGVIYRGMAQTAGAMGQPRQARDFALLAVQSDRGVYGEDHDRNMRSLMVLGRQELQFGHLNEAAQHLSEVQQIADQLGSSHPNYAYARFYDASLQHRLGRLGLARKRLAEAQISRAEVYGTDDRALLEFSLTLAAMQLREGFTDDAMAVLPGLADQLGVAYGSGHGLTLTAQALLGHGLLAQGDTNGALDQLNAALNTAQGLAAQPLQYSEILTDIARVQLALGEVAPAQATIDQALAFHSRRFGVDSPAVLVKTVVAAKIYATAGRTEWIELLSKARRLAASELEQGGMWAIIELAELASLAANNNLDAQASELCRQVISGLDQQAIGTTPAGYKALAQCKNLPAADQDMPASRS